MYAVLLGNVNDNNVNMHAVKLYLKSAHQNVSVKVNIGETSC